MKSTPLLVLSGLILAGPLLGQEPAPPIKVETYKKRRQALMQRLKEGVVVLRDSAGTASGMNEFWPRENFYYLTGVVQKNVALILFPATGRDMLLVEPFSRFTAQWEGERITPSEANAKKLMFDEVRVVRSLPSILAEVLAAGQDGARPVCWTSGQRRRGRRARDAGAAAPSFGRPPADPVMFANELREMFEGLEVRDVDSHIAALRGVKDAEEIALIKAATRIACDGIAEAMKSTEPGVYEFQVAAAARYVFHRSGANGDAYAAIVGAGINGCVLHYSANSKKTLDGELIVMDYAPTVQGYASDVTRTFPVNGRFTEAQRKLVQDVHDVQEILIAMVKPGASLRDISRRSSEELSKRGYRSAHGPCHHVGLNVHDVGGGVLEPGMLITVEPGAYLNDQKMGCRIEDVILVTKDGHINLSGHLPSTPEGIEALMRHDGIQQQAVGIPAPAQEKAQKPAR